MSDLLTFVILAFVTYRVTRLAILDTIFDTPRNWVHSWLLNGNDPAKWRGKWWTGLPVGFLVGSFIGAGILLLYFGAPRWVGVAPLVLAPVVLLVCWLFVTSGPTWLGMYAEKMISCPYCLTIWVGGALELMVWPVRSIPLPAVYFLALSAAGMVVYQYIDFEPEEDNELD